MRDRHRAGAAAVGYTGAFVHPDGHLWMVISPPTFNDLDAAKAFFAELGMELEGETQVEAPWVDRTVGLNDVRADLAMMRTPDGHGRVELTKFHTPPAVRAEPENAPANTLGIRRIMFTVDDIDDVVARLRSHGAELVGEIAQYEDSYRLCFLRGPEGIIIGLAEQLS
jgi:catechol 2,3-dioxygenase-like lactoylglutathione lyase family enzyme